MLHSWVGREIEVLVRFRFGRSEFLRNTTLLMAGTGLGQLIPFLLQPLLRRIYEPEDFGAFAIYFSVIGVLTVIANFRYDQAIGLPESDEDGANVLFLALALNFSFNVIAFVVAIVIHHDVARLLKLPGAYAGFLLLVPASTFLACSFQAMNYWLIRKKAFRPLALNKIWRRGAEGTVQVAFGIGGSPAGLFWADVAGHLANNASGLRHLAATGVRLRSGSWTHIAAMMRRYREFPTFALVPQVLGTVAMQVPVLLINRFFGTARLGLFDLAQQAVLMPFALVSMSVSQVLLQQVVERRHARARLLPDFMRISVLLAVAGVAAIGVLWIAGPALFGLVFGSTWAVSGTYAQMLIPGYAAYLVAFPMTSVLVGLEEIKRLSVWNVFHLALMGSLALCGQLSVMAFLGAVAAIEVTAFGTLWLMALLAVRRYDRRC